ncbi:MAG: FAD-binding oxidoreductase, partial [Myxococcales bacterium]|nr:FAD-binding oxidoreductase [Myxococcales bacterium]
MPHRNKEAVVIGAGVFGVAAAKELRARGHAVTLVDPGPVPHPLAASTDVSKLVRGDYGHDALYTGLMAEALPLWARWNATLPRPLVHFSGWTVLSTTPMAPGTYEGDSFAALEARGAVPERLDAGAIARRFPAWGEGGFVDGYVNPRVGWTESGEVVARLVAEAVAAGVVL